MAVKELMNTWGYEYVGEHYENNEGVHMGNPIDGEFTLCGWACDVDPTEDTMPDGIDGLKSTSKTTITCPQCITIIDACRRARTRRI